MQRRKARLLQTHGAGREDYEFEVLPTGGDIQASELYDAFAGEEEYLRKSGDHRRGSMDDGEMGGFLADSEGEDDDDDEDGDEKAQRRLLRDQSR